MNPLESMALQILMGILTQGAEAVAVPFATVGRKLEPTATDTQLVTYVEGQLEHWARGHLRLWGIDLGFLVDLLWSNPTVQGLILPIVTQAVQSTQPPTPPTINGVQGTSGVISNG